MIYLLRHGDAKDGDGDDAVRRLTPKGERQARAAGRALAARGAEIDACLASPKVRAAQTAQLACEALGIEPETANELRGGDFDALALAITHLRIGALIQALRPKDGTGDDRVSANGLRALLGKKRRTRATGPKLPKLSRIR